MTDMTLYPDMTYEIYKTRNEDGIKQQTCSQSLIIWFGCLLERLKFAGYS